MTILQRETLKKFKEIKKEIDSILEFIEDCESVNDYATKNIALNKMLSYHEQLRKYFQKNRIIIR